MGTPCYIAGGRYPAKADAAACVVGAARSNPQLDIVPMRAINVGFACVRVRLDLIGLSQTDRDGGVIAETIVGAAKEAASAIE